MAEQSFKIYKDTAERLDKNALDIASLKEELGDIESKFEIETEDFVDKCSIIRNNTPNNYIGNQVTGLKQYFDFGKNADEKFVKTGKSVAGFRKSVYNETMDLRDMEKAEVP